MAIPGLGQAKELMKMRQMQKQMQQIVIKGFSKDEKVSVTLDGTQSLVAVRIDDSLLEEGNSKKIEEAFKQAHKDAQTKLNKEIMKGMDLNQLKGMFGG